MSKKLYQCPKCLSKYYSLLGSHRDPPFNLLCLKCEYIFSQEEGLTTRLKQEGRIKLEIT